MDEIQKEALINLKNESRRYKEMASAISVSESAVKSFFSRKKLKAEEICMVCKSCGGPLTKRLGNKKFCSDSCRYKCWRQNTNGNRKCVKISICKKCGKELKCYDNKNRKYCSHACYIADRFKNKRGC